MAPTIIPQYEYYYNTELLPSGNQTLSQTFYQPNYIGVSTDNFIQEDYISPENLTDNFDEINSFSSPEDASLFLEEGDQGLRLDYLQNIDFEFIPGDKGFGEQPQEYHNGDLKEYPNETVVENNKVDQIIQEVVQNSSPELKEPRKRTAMAINCEICGLFLKHPSKINAHMRTHTGERPFVCEYCGKSFTQRTPWRCHVRRHIGDTPFQCAHCEKSFPNASSRKAHEVRVHEKSKNEKAEFVGFLNTSFLDSKSPGSTSEVKKYEPQIISEIIDDVASGKIKIEDDEKFISKTARLPMLEICPYCGLHLKYPSRIQQHMRSHAGLKPYSCNICGQFFASTSTLRVHQGRFHMVDRPHPCRWHCGKKFPARSHRNEHEKIVHSKIKRYQCGISDCNKLFTRRLYLIKHLEKCHNDRSEDVKGFRVVAIPYEKNETCVKVPSNFNLSTAKIFIDGDGTSYIVDTMGPIEAKLQRNPVLIEDAILQMLCNENLQETHSSTESSSVSSLDFHEDEEFLK